jgi:hypothetical protein
VKNNRFLDIADCSIVFVFVKDNQNKYNEFSRGSSESH